MKDGRFIKVERARAMGKIISYFCLCAALVWAPASQAGMPVLRDGGTIQESGSTMDVGYYTAPEVVDWNEDGKKDLLVGKFYSGDAKLFINQGTDEVPVFTSGSLIQVGGGNLNVGYT
jgi:hypothetical protein